MNDPSNRQTYGDTTYITIPAINLPLLQPLLDIGTDTGTSWLIKPIVDLIQPTLRVLIDLGYNRTIPYGQPTPAGLFPDIDPSTLAANLAAAVSQGIDDALADVGLTSISPLAPSTAANPSTLADTQAADSATATPQNTEPLPQSQSSTSTPSDAAAATAATGPKTGPGMNTLATALAATNRNTAAAPQTTPSSVATKPEKPTSPSPGAFGLPPVTPLTPSDIGTPNMPSTKTAVPTGGAGPDATGAVSSHAGNSSTAHSPSPSAASTRGGR